MITFQVVLTNELGVLQAVITDYKRLSYVIRGDSSAGAFTMTVDRQKYESQLTPSNVDWRIQIFRRVNDYDTVLEGRTEFVIEVMDSTDTEITISGGDLQSIIARRVNAYASQRTGFAFSGNADNVIKDVVRRNFITALTGRDGSATNFSISQYLSVDANTSSCPSVSFSASRDNCLDIIKSVSDSSAYLGTWVCGRIVSTGTPLSWAFQTFPTQFGTNRQSLVLSRESKNIENIRFVYDRTTESTSMIVGGSGEDTQRIIGTADASAITLSPFYRKEYFYSNPQVDDTTNATSYAYSLLRLQRATLTFSADIINSNFFVRGVDYNLGDIITVQFLSQYYVCRLNVVYVNIQGSEVSEKGELILI